MVVSVGVMSSSGEEMEAAEADDEAGVAMEGVMVAGGGAGAEKARLEHDTMLSRAWMPKVGGP
jgi:hypothetical protein